MKNVFITGADGFVGKQLIAELEKRKIPYKAGRRSLYGDISTQSDLKPFLIDCDYVVHLAARVHVMKEKANDPLPAFRKMNVEATVNLAKAAMECGVKRFIFISSIKVNGEETFEKPFSSIDVPTPQDPYGISKAEAESELLKMHRPGIFEIVIIRPPLVYGPGVKANFEKLLSIANLHIPLPFGLVKNKRSFVSVFNLIDLIIKTLNDPRASGEIFLVSDDHDLSLVELISLMAKVQKTKVIFLPVPVTIMSFAAKILNKKSYADRLFGNLQLDIEKTKKILEWSPPYTFEETFKKN